IRLSTARPTIPLRGVTHTPLPTTRPATSGTTAPSAPTTNLSNWPRSLLSPVTMQRRCGDCDGSEASPMGGMSVAVPTVGLLPPGRNRFHGSRRGRGRGGLVSLEPVGAGLHDQRIGLLELELGAALIGGREHLQELVARQIGEVVERLDTVLAERDEHARSQAFERDKLVADPKRFVALLIFAVAPLEGLPRPFLQLARDVSVEAFDAGKFVDGHERHLFERAEALGHQQMGDDLVDI